MNRLKRFESIVYDTEYIEEVEKVVSAIHSCGIKDLVFVDLLPLGFHDFSEYKQGHMKVNDLFGNGYDGESLIKDLNSILKSDFFQTWIENLDSNRFAFLMEMGDNKIENKEKHEIINCYFDPNYMSIESDGDEATFMNESHFEYQYKFNKSMCDLLKNLSNIGYSLYRYRWDYIITKNK